MFSIIGDTMLFLLKFPKLYGKEYVFEAFGYSEQICFDIYYTSSFKAIKEMEFI